VSYAYKPSPWGQEFHNLPHREALGAGSAGPGKSIVLLHEADRQIWTEHERCANRGHPHHQAWGASTGWVLHLRRTRLMLEQTIVRSHKVFPLMDPGARWDQQKSTWIFSSGLRYQFGHCNNQDDWEQYLSFEFSMILYDELVQFNEVQYDQINTRLRSSDPVLKNMLKIRAMSNPVMRKSARDDFTVNDPYWVRKRFVDKHPPGRKTFFKVLTLESGERVKYNWIYLPAKLSDNPDAEFRRSYEIQLRNAPGHIKKALLDGDWYVTAGSFYGYEWDYDKHVCEPFAIPPDWPMFRSMDWGYRSGAAIHWWAVSPEDTLYCIHEWKFRMKKPEQVAERIAEIEKDLGVWKGRRSMLSGPADTQLWEERGNEGLNKARDFLEHGVFWAKASKKSRQANCERLLGMIRDHHHGTKLPGIVFFNTCSYAIRTIPSIQSDDTNPEEPQKGGDDHGHDSVLYACAYASRGSVGISLDEIREELDDDEDRGVSRRDRGQLGYGSTV
jgi:hypothetical protein